MIASFATLAAVAVVSGAAVYFALHKLWSPRIETLERDLQRFSSAMNQMADLQMKVYQKLIGNMEGLEERIVDLAVPSSDGRLPLERRHRVLTLARKGVALEQIAKRLNLPTGEVELILNLRKYLDAALPRAAKAIGEMKRHA